MEARLKQELLAEAELMGGLSLLHREVLAEGATPVMASTYDPCRRFDDAPGNSVESFWEPLDATVIQTPREVVGELLAQGWSLRYRRIPQTRCRPAEPVDVDLVRRQMEAGLGSCESAQFVFMSHTGVGSVAHAMALAVCCLMGSGGPQKLALPPVSISPSLAEHRDVLSLLRVLKQGPACQQDVEAALSVCGAGNLLDDLRTCQATVEGNAGDDQVGTPHR